MKVEIPTLLWGKSEYQPGLSPRGNVSAHRVQSRAAGKANLVGAYSVFRKDFNAQLLSF